MKIRKNGKVINLTESDLRRIVKRVISEGEIIVPISKKDIRQRRRAERKERRDDKRMLRKDGKNVNPQEITDFIKNGGSIYNSSNKEITGDGESGYKFQESLSDGRVVLGWRKGEGLVIVIDPENKTYEIYERGGMSDRWNVTEEGSFMFDGKKINLS